MTALAALCTFFRTAAILKAEPPGFADGTVATTSRARFGTLPAFQADRIFRADVTAVAPLGARFGAFATFKAKRSLGAGIAVAAIDPRRINTPAPTETLFTRIADLIVIAGDRPDFRAPPACQARRPFWTKSSALAFLGSDLRAPAPGQTIGPLRTAVAVAAIHPVGTDAASAAETFAAGIADGIVAARDRTFLGTPAAFDAGCSFRADRPVPALLSPDFRTFAATEAISASRAMTAIAAINPIIADAPPAAETLAARIANGIITALGGATLRTAAAPQTIGPGGAIPPSTTVVPAIPSTIAIPAASCSRRTAAPAEA